MKSKLISIIKTLLVISLTACTVTGVWAVYHYLNTAPRFNVRQISVQGLKRVDETDVMERIKLKTDSKTNIFAVDMEDVRARVEQIQWIHHVTVLRVIPDQIIINVVEREPIGLARVGGNIYEFDSDGAMLEPDRSQPKFPILDGLHENDIEGNLKKIAMYRKVCDDLGAAILTQVIVNQSNEVSVMRDEDPLIVNLGVEDFKERWSRYLALKPAINQYKDIVHVDLRFRNKAIVSKENDNDDGKVIWDGKKRSL